MSVGLEGDAALREQLLTASSREELWQRFVAHTGIVSMAEVGVFRGRFAAHLLAAASGIERYYMLDPWRHLPDWNKPSNRDDDELGRFYREALESTAFAAERRVVLRGKTTEVADRIPDGGLDFAYIDGDHTLRGICIDLVRLYPKVRDGGWIGGDDFTTSVWQHSEEYEPTFVFPFAVYFAEAVAAPIHALPFGQFLIEKRRAAGFHFHDLVNRYGDVTLRRQLLTRRGSSS